MTALKSDSLVLTRPDDWHLHLRDGEAMGSVVGYSAAVFGRALIMPNLKPPVSTVALARAYRERILHATRDYPGFTPLMTLYLTDNLLPEEITLAKESGFVHAVKLYPAGATTNSDAGVTDIRKVCRVLEQMEKVGLVLSIHGEVTDPSVDVFDREAVFIERVLIPIRREFPGLRIVLEHVTTSEGVAYVQGAEAGIAATITAHHLLMNRNALFEGGLRPHHYCLPVAKREQHRQALIAAATSGNPRFFLGTDSAPHAKGAKENACGCAGCFTAPQALSLYAGAFEQAEKLDMLEGFAAYFGADFYGLPRNTDTLRLIRTPWRVPQECPFGEGEVVAPFWAGEVLSWMLDFD